MKEHKFKIITDGTGNYTMQHVYDLAATEDIGSSELDFGGNVYRSMGLIVKMYGYAPTEAHLKNRNRYKSYVYGNHDLQKFDYYVNNIYLLPMAYVDTEFHAQEICAMLNFSPLRKEFARVHSQ